MASSSSARPRGIKRRRTTTITKVIPMAGGGITFQRGRRAAPSAAPVELKFFDTLVGATAPTTAGAIASPSLVLIPQGVTETTRIGRKCTIKKIGMRGMLSIAANDADGVSSSVQVRFIVYLDKQANGGPATVTGDNGLLQDADHLSFNDLGNSGRFRVLHDFIENVTQLSGAYTGVNDIFAKVTKAFSWFKKVDIPLEYSNTAGAITELRSNNIGVLVIADSAVGSFTYRVRVRFSDS